jgi:hypothetical protein
MASVISASTTSGTALNMTADTTGILQLATGATPTTAVTIDASQNVGIGTTSPISGANVSLTANGSIAVSGGLSVDQTSRGIFDFSTNAARFLSYGAVGTVGSYIWYAGSGGVSPTERMKIDSTGYVTNTVNGGGAGLHQAQLLYRLNSGNAGSNATGAQSIFGVGVPLLASTQYEFEMAIALTKTAGTNSHTIALGYGGTATINNILVQTSGNFVGGQPPVTQLATGSVQLAVSNSVASNVVSVASVTASVTFFAIVKGTVSINAAGTFIPQYTLSAAPGGAFTTAIGSYIKISPLAASGANVNIGSWA